MLKITRHDEPLQVKNLVAVIYSPPGVGKTTLGFSASKPLLLDFDGGAYRSANRGDSVQVSSWPDIAGIAPDDLEGYDTVVVDTAGRALDALAADIIHRNPKMGRAGALTLQGYGQLKAEFTAWVKLIRSFGRDLVLLAHSTEDKSGDDLIERIDMQGSSKGEVYKVADMMGRLHMIPGRKMPILTFSPSDTAFGKNPAQLEPLNVPDVAQEPAFLAGVIQQTKDALNALTEAQQARQQAVADWVEKIEQAEDADAINALIPEVKKADKPIQPTIKAAIHKRATESLGLEPDKKSGTYIEKAQPVEEAA